MGGQAGHLLPGLAAVVRAEEGGRRNAAVDDARLRWPARLDVPQPVQLQPRLRGEAEPARLLPRLPHVPGAGEARAEPGGVGGRVDGAGAAVERGGGYLQAVEKGN